jgi:acyl-CoA reductase-like NAD-dependent aldehyde dehydrogenase
MMCGGPDVGAAVAAHPHVAMVSFTGSPRADRAVAHAAADRYGLYGPEEHTRVRHVVRAW